MFPEASVTTDLAETIAAETGASADYELYGDTLGPEGSTGATYLDMIACERRRARPRLHRRRARMRA